MSIQTIKLGNICQGVLKQKWNQCIYMFNDNKMNKSLKKIRDVNRSRRSQLESFFILQFFRCITFWSCKVFNFPITQLRQDLFALKTISHISFTNLITLKIQTGQIASIEQIYWFNCPNLQKIYLSEGIFGNLKPLSKTNLVKLESFQMQRSKCNGDQLKYFKRMLSKKSIQRKNFNLKVSKSDFPSAQIISDFTALMSCGIRIFISGFNPYQEDEMQDSLYKRICEGQQQNDINQDGYNQDKKVKQNKKSYKNRRILMTSSIKLRHQRNSTCNLQSQNQMIKIKLSK